MGINKEKITFFKKIQNISHKRLLMLIIILKQGHSWVTGTSFFSILIIDKIISDGIKFSSYLSLEPYRPRWPRGGMVTRRIANPFIPVRFWTWPPKIIVGISSFGVKNS